MTKTKLVTTKDIAERHGVRPATVLAWVRSGAIPCIRASRRFVRFDPQEVDKALRITASARPVQNNP